MRLCRLNLKNLYARLENSFAQNFPCGAHTGPKKNFPIGFQTVQPKKKNVVRKDFLRLTPSKWSSSWNTGMNVVNPTIGADQNGRISQNCLTSWESETVSKPLPLFEGR